MPRSRARSDPLPGGIKYEFVNQQPSYSPRISQVQWSLNEEYIRFLHGLEYTRDQILALLRERRGFCPSLNQLNAQMKLWGLRVYRKPSKIDNLTRILPSWNEISAMTSSSRRVRDNTISGLPATRSSELLTSAGGAEKSSSLSSNSEPKFVAEDLMDGMEDNRTAPSGERTLSPMWNTANCNRSYSIVELSDLSSQNPYSISDFPDVVPELESCKPYGCPIPAQGSLCPEHTKSDEPAFVPLDEPVCDLEPSLSVRKHDRTFFENASQQSERSMLSLAMRLQRDVSRFVKQTTPSLSAQSIPSCTSGSWSFRRLTGLSSHLGSVDFMEVDG